MDIVANYNVLNRGYNVTLEFVAEAAWNERITAAQAGGTAPEIRLISYNQIVTEAKNGAIQPLTGMMKDEYLSDITDAAKAMVSIGDQVYAFPMWTEPSVLLYYRKDLLQEAGLQVPTTWAELIDAATKLTTADRFGLAIMAGGDAGWSTWGMQYGTAGHLPITDNWDAANVDQAYVDLACFFRDLYDSEAVPAQALSGYGAIDPFATGAVAMQLNGSWAVATLIKDYPELEGKYGIAVCPTIDGDLTRCTATMGGWAMAVDGKTDKGEGCADFISYMMCEDPTTWGGYFDDCSYSRSACTNAIAASVNEKAAAAGYEWAATINEVAAHAIAEPVYPWDISWSVAVMFQNVFMHTMEPEEALQVCIDSINKVITDQNLAGANPSSN